MKSRISDKVEVRSSGINKKGMFAKEYIYIRGRLCILKVDI